METIQVLFVDDDEFICKDLMLKFRRLDHGVEYKTYSVSSGNQAISIIKETAIDIVITDVRMPFLSGTGLIKIIREGGFQGQIYVLSGFDDYDSIRTAFLNGSNDYFLKPIMMAQLDQKLKRYLQSRVQPNALPASEEPKEDKKSLRVIDFAIEYIHQHYMNPDLSMAMVADHVMLSYSHFSMLFRKETKQPFPAYLLKYRVAKAKILLQDPSMKITDVGYKVGFNYPQQFSRDFKKITGVYPSQYVKNHFKPEDNDAATDC